MTRYDPKLMLTLLRKGRELAEHPSQEGRAESLDLLSQIANMEQLQETPLSPVSSKATLRGGSSSASRIGKQPVAFTLNDAQGNQLALILETSPIAEGLRLSGELFAQGTSNWDSFTVVVSQKANILDYFEVEGTGEFSLLLSQPGFFTVKIISALGEIILLEGVEIASD